MADQTNQQHKRQRTYRTHALILRRRDYSDADRVITIFTPSMGKLVLIAKGIRKTTSRKAGHLELFTHSSLMVAQARTWPIITEAATVESFRHLRQDLDNIGRTSYVCELLDSFTEIDDENQPLWELVLMILRELDAASMTPEEFDLPLLLRWFELQLLNVTGFQPQLFHCVRCDEELQPMLNYLSLLEGGAICPNCIEAEQQAFSGGPYKEAVEQLTVDVLKVLRFLQSQSWGEVRKLTIRPHILQRVENILYRYLLTILERQLKSVDFLRRLSRSSNSFQS